jgi:quinoprotein glucose dehydrogenase
MIGYITIGAVDIERAKIFYNSVLGTIGWKQFADYGDPIGYVQAFNARTGKRVWTYSVIPQSAKDPGAETWGNESWRRSGHGNVWAPMALDEARGLLYLPTTTPSSDYYGGNRPGANLFAESVVCLDANTGKRIWSAEYPTLYRDDFGFDEGPRGTPAVAV